MDELYPLSLVNSANEKDHRSITYEDFQPYRSSRPYHSGRRTGAEHLDRQRSPDGQPRAHRSAGHGISVDHGFAVDDDPFDLNAVHNVAVCDHPFDNFVHS